jgi:hypothetical protein
MGIRWAQIDAAFDSVVARWGAELASAAVIACGLGAWLTIAQPPTQGWLGLPALLLWATALSVAGHYGLGKGERFGLALGGIAVAVLAWATRVVPSLLAAIFLEEVAIYAVVATLEWRRR